MIEKWVETTKRADFQQIAQQFGIDPVTARLIRNRDIVGEDQIKKYLYGSRTDLYSPWLMKDMEKIVELLQQSILCKKSIRIIGDYDIDGIMSTYILFQGLLGLGATVDYMIPDRIEDGYGLNEHLIERAHAAGVQTIVTCDNGISARTQIERAKVLGMTVLVTDHHDVPFEDTDEGRMEILPPADAIVNPKQEKCTYPFKKLCGACVALKVMQALYEKMQPMTDIVDKMLEYAAIATIGDIMELKDENRIFVKEGLRRLHKTTNLGLQELMRVNNLDPEKVGPYHIGFVLGPCLNASGRLDTAHRALKMLCAKTREEAAHLAGDLHSLNESRKELTAQGVETAIALVENSEICHDSVLIVYLPECHESLAGIIAGRIRERYGKPTFVLTKTLEGVKGSGRSIEAYSMFEKMSECKEFLTKFGGHPMAAGLSMASEEDIEPFRRKINALCGLKEEDFVEKVKIDVRMPIAYITRKRIQELAVLEPFGTGNEKPNFAQKGLRVAGLRVLGKNRNVAKMKLIDENGYAIDGVYFGEADAFAAEASQRKTLSVLYYPEINSYMGRETLQVVIKSYQ